MKKTLKFRKRSQGFTLVELVIVIAIVIILSVVSVPIYRSYVDKAKWSEGYALLGTILSAQKNYYSEHGHFLARESSSNPVIKGFTSYESVLGIDIRGNKYFTLFMANISAKNELNPTHYFEAAVRIPAELQENDGKHYFALHFGTDTGHSYYKFTF